MSSNERFHQFHQNGLRPQKRICDNKTLIFKNVPKKNGPLFSKNQNKHFFVQKKTSMFFHLPQSQLSGGDRLCLRHRGELVVGVLGRDTLESKI